MSKTIRLLMLLVVAFGLGTGQAKADGTWESGDCTVTLTGNTLTIAKKAGDGNGAMADYVIGDAPWFGVRDDIKTVVIEEGVTTIASAAFFCCDVTSVTIPSSVTTIGRNAFQGCDLTEVAIPASVTSIAGYAFFLCSEIETITVAEGNGSYDSRGGCNAIIETGTNTLILGCKNTVIPASVTGIGGDAFYGCSGLTSVTIPAGVTSIGVDAFNGCSDVTDVYCYADPANPANLTWTDGGCDDFMPGKATLCHVAGSKLATFQGKWDTGSTDYIEGTDVNVTFVGDGLESKGETYVAGTATYKSGTTPEGVKAFLPVTYDLNTGAVTLVELMGAPKDQPVIFGSTTAGEALPALFFLNNVADDSDDALAIKSDYDGHASGISRRFAITDGTKTLAEVISGTGVDASEAVILVLANGKFTSVNVSADDLEKKAKAGLLLLVLSKWEYMQVKPSAQSATAPLSTRTIGIDFGGATGIVATEHTDKVSDVWYDLQGRRLNGKPTKKGVYVKNHKKTMINQ